MRKLFFSLTFLMVGLFLFPQQKQPAVFTVSGKITQTSSYCGGARPSNEMLEEYAHPKAYRGKTLYVRKGAFNDVKQNIVLKFTADSLGKFTFTLPVGTYCILQAEQVKALDLKKLPDQQGVTKDVACLKTWWKTPLQVLTIKDKNVSGLDFNFHHPCFVSGDIPCMNYNGPMPP